MALGATCQLARAVQHRDAAGIARVETLLSALYAVAAAMASEPQHVALATMVGVIMEVGPGSSITDHALVANLSRILAALGAPNFITAVSASITQVVVEPAPTLTIGLEVAERLSRSQRLSSRIQEYTALDHPMIPRLSSPLS